MITLVSGSLLEAEVDAMVNPVNCVGVMGKGLALQFKQTFPENFQLYKAACEQKRVVPGQMFVVDLDGAERPWFVVNFPTKRHWRSRSRLGDIDSGLTALVQESVRQEWQSIAIPPLGCGLGGLDWDDVRPLIEDRFSDDPELNVLLFEPMS